MRKDILEDLQKDIFERCRKETNKFGMGCYYHIAAVVKNAEILAEKYKADKEVAMMEIEEGKEFVKDKLARSFQKLSAESKKYYHNKFERVMEVLG